MSGNGISWAICKSAPHTRQTTMPAPHHSVFYSPDALPAAQPTASKHWRQAKNNWWKRQVHLQAVGAQLSDEGNVWWCRDGGVVIVQVVQVSTTDDQLLTFELITVIILRHLQTHAGAYKSNETNLQNMSSRFQDRFQWNSSRLVRCYNQHYSVLADNYQSGSLTPEITVILFNSNSNYHKKYTLSALSWQPDCC